MESDFVTPTVVQSIVKAEVDMQISTAKQYPRSLGVFHREAQDMACLSEDIASRCKYALKREGKIIAGPSVRFAEIVLSAWGNARAGSRIVSEDDRFVVAQGFFHDLERNVFITSDVRRRITGKRGRYNDDMIGTTSNAAGSIALRNAIFKGIPQALWSPIMEAVDRTIAGDEKTLTTRRKAALDFVKGMGAKEPFVLAALDVKSAEDVGINELSILKGMITAIRDGESTIEEQFPDPAKIEEKRAEKGMAGLKAAVDSATLPQEGPKEAAGATKTADPTLVLVKK